MTMSDGCCVPESDMIIARDMNMDVPFKGGNQYARICPDCGGRTFTSKSYYNSVDEPYIIPKGSKEPIPKAEHDAEEEEGEEELMSAEEGAEEMPDGDEFEDDASEEGEEEEEADEDEEAETFDCPYGCGGVVEVYESPCPTCGEEIEWED